ncbi:MAG: nuclear transport factor 2 family protein [Eudoraea sp.]|nr:nuclear transport factor 2 family protein [Eudoraea sp.]
MIDKLIVILCILCLLACGQNNESTSNSSVVSDASTEKEILRYLKEVEWPQAYREQDTVLLDRILGDEFQMVAADGEWSDKAGQMARIKAAPMDHDHFSYEIKRLEILENGTAIIAGTGHIINNATESIYQSSNILIKREGVWKAVLSHVSGINELENMHEHGYGKLPSEGDFSYLLGSWKRTNEEAGKETFEHWSKINDELYFGFGYTMAASDTVWKEDVELRRSEDHWHFEVLGQGDSIPTPFKVTHIEQNAFQCYNPVNEFPKKIRYWREGEQLKASISDDQMEILFNFEKAIQ